MSKSRDAFRTISEVSDLLDTPAHVLRFWESKFSQVKPVKRAGGRRYYRPTDVDLLAGIKKLLHDDGMTIKGAQKLLREQGVKHVGAMGAAILDDITPADTLSDVGAQTGDVTPLDLAPDTASPVAAADTVQPKPQDASTNVVPLPTVAEPDIAQAVDLEIKSDAPVAAAPEPKAASDIRNDPADSDSKEPARLFHLLHRASHDGLAARAEAIAPLLDRMQVLRDRISAR